MVATLIDLAYLLAASLFIVGMKRLQSPSTARQGNRLSSIAMLIAVLATLFVARILTPSEMLLGLVIGSGIGVVLARRVEMTSMPEMVGALNGFGGASSALVAGAELMRYIAWASEPASVAAPSEPFTASIGVTIFLSILIGVVTFSGSFVAVGKLSGKVSGNPISFPGMRILTLLLAIAVVAGHVMVAIKAGVFPNDSQQIMWAALALCVVAFFLGILLVIPIGGADMPVVIALLNSYSGLAASATGFVLDNTALIVSGALVGASGLILTKIMCDAMNRSLFNVLLGGFGGDSAGDDGATKTSFEGKSVRSTSPEDVAIMLSYAENVVIVPGYGMAVAQAQHQVRELADLLQAKGVTVKYAIHPVAGRMPGHMNVLLAEANVPYDQLYEMDDINGEFDNTDVSLIIGANDVVNPAARHDKSSPIYGMPILNVDKSRNVVILKRSMRPGYSGVENELFFYDNAQLLFGDAKDSIVKLTNEVKALD
ncbi:MAG: NAD(P)(+) transhydrogenase (Re/Si-specific) subunit beta [Rhodothermales bacterium]